MFFFPSKYIMLVVQCLNYNLYETSYVDPLVSWWYWSSITLLKLKRKHWKHFFFFDWLSFLSPCCHCNIQEPFFYVCILKFWTNVFDRGLNVLIGFSTAAALYAHIWYCRIHPRLIHLLMISALNEQGFFRSKITELNTQWNVSIKSYSFGLPLSCHCSTVLWQQEANGHRWFCSEGRTSFFFSHEHVWHVILD